MSGNSDNRDNRAKELENDFKFKLHTVKMLFFESQSEQKKARFPNEKRAF